MTPEEKKDYIEQTMKEPCWANWIGRAKDIASNAHGAALEQLEGELEADDISIDSHPIEFEAVTDAMDSEFRRMSGEVTYDNDPFDKLPKYHDLA